LTWDIFLTDGPWDPTILGRMRNCTATICPSVIRPGRPASGWVATLCRIVECVCLAPGSTHLTSNGINLLIETQLVKGGVR